MGLGAPRPHELRFGSALRREPTRPQPLRGKVIGVYGSAGAPWHHLALAAAHGATVRPVRAEDIRAGRLDELDAFVMPGGGAIAMAGLLDPLGEAGAIAIRHWVEEGGTYISSCAGSVLPLALTDEAAAALPLATCLRMTDVPLANPGDATLGGLASPGVGRIRVRVDRTHPFAAGLPESVELVHYNGPFFDVAAVSDPAPGADTEPPSADDRHPAQAAPRPFAWPADTLAEFTPAERFMAPPSTEDAGSHVGPTDEDLVVTNSIEAGAATGMVVGYGLGRVVMFGSHPEFGLGPLALGWGRGAQLLVAALKSGDRIGSTGGSDDPPWSVASESEEIPTQDVAERVVEGMRSAAERFGALATHVPEAWLTPEMAPSLGGRDAPTAWRVDATYAAAVLAAAADDLHAFSHRLTAFDRGWLDDAPREDQDFGFMGLVQLLERIHAQLDGAEAAVHRDPVRPAHAYDLFDTHPFHLAVGTYLSAAGLSAGALLATVVLARKVGAPTPKAELVLWAGESTEVAA